MLDQAEGIGESAACTRFNCYLVEGYDGPVYAGRCTVCGELHSYGAATAGLRARKCRADLSPGRNEAINLDVLGEAISFGAIDLRPVPYAESGRSLCPTLSSVELPLTKVLASAAIGAKRLQYWTRRRLGGSVVDVFEFGARWHIENNIEKRFGCGAVPLLAALSSASVGAVAVMILRLLGVELTPGDLRQIRDFIDAQLLTNVEVRR